MGRRLLKYLMLLFVMLGGCNADFHSKKWANCNLKEKESITVIKNFVNLGFAENRGMVFGILNGHIPQNYNVILQGLRALILVALTFFIWINRKRQFLFLLPFLLIWAGAIGNLIDPFTYGYVVDFIHIHVGSLINWPFYFNLADAYVTIGTILLLTSTAFGNHLKNAGKTA